MKKLALSVVAAGLLGISGAVAETDGAFVGAQLGFGGSKVEIDDNIDGVSSSSDTASGLHLGVVGGYKQFFTENFGARYYGVLDYGTYSYTGADVNAININVNADALYNFISQDELDIGVFGGLSLGLASQTLSFDDGSESLKPSGFDLGVNLGFRANFAQNHGVEIYSRFSFLKQSDDLSGNDGGDWKYESKLSQPYAVGIRYVFSF